MTARSPRWCCVGLVAVCLVTLAATVGALPASAADTTDPGTLVGEGGSFLTPVTDVLLKADTSGLAPLNPSYTDANLDGAITDFVGDGPGSFDADFVVSERPLTSGEAATAKADGRTFAYVPFAATPGRGRDSGRLRTGRPPHGKLDCRHCARTFR